MTVVPSLQMRADGRLRHLLTLAGLPREGKLDLEDKIRLALQRMG